MKISCHGLECNIKLSSPDREGWMDTAVDVRVPNFEGSFSCAVEIEEWKAFVRLLQQLESAVGSDVQASWESMEANIEFTFSLNRTGGLEGSYRLRSGDLGPQLSGQFSADQSFLSQWVESALGSLEHARYQANGVRTLRVPDSQTAMPFARGSFAAL